MIPHAGQEVDLPELACLCLCDDGVMRCGPCWLRLCASNLLLVTSCSRVQWYQSQSYVRLEDLRPVGNSKDTAGGAIRELAGQRLEGITVVFGEPKERWMKGRDSKAEERLCRPCGRCRDYGGGHTFMKLC